MIQESNHPFTLVEDTRFIQFVLSLNSSFQPPTEEVLKSRILSRSTSSTASKSGLLKKTMMNSSVCDQFEGSRKECGEERAHCKYKSRVESHHLDQINSSNNPHLQLHAKDKLMKQVTNFSKLLLTN